MEEIRKYDNVTFRYVPSSENTADIASGGCRMEELNNSPWKTGPLWLLNETLWPENIKLENFNDNEIQDLNIKNLLMPETNTHTQYLFGIAKYSDLYKMLRITIYIQKAFRPNSKCEITVLELEKAEKFWVKTI